MIHLLSLTRHGGFKFSCQHKNKKQVLIIFIYVKPAETRTGDSHCGVM